MKLTTGGKGMEGWTGGCEVGQERKRLTMTARLFLFCRWFSANWEPKTDQFPKVSLHNRAVQKRLGPALKCTIPSAPLWHMHAQHQAKCVHVPAW